jgi:hypothetical protein
MASLDRTQTEKYLTIRRSLVFLDLGKNWGKIGAKLGQNWGKIGAKLGQNWSKIGAKLGQNWDKIGYIGGIYGANQSGYILVTH